MKPVLLSFLWLFLSTGILFGSVGLFQYTYFEYPDVIYALEHGSVLGTRSQVTGNSDEVRPSGMEASLEAEDARPAIVANFLERHNSPLQPYDHYGKVLVEIADRYGIDFRLLPAIAMQESNLCKAIPPGSNNCLGFGVHERGTLGFQKYEDGFERAAKELKKYYIDIGLTTPEQIMTKYTPSSNGSWANSVNQWMAEMRYDDRGKGRTEKTDADLLEFVSQ